MFLPARSILPRGTPSRPTPGILSNRLGHSKTNEGEPKKCGPILSRQLVENCGEEVTNGEAIEFARRWTKEGGVLSAIASGAAAVVAVRLAKDAELAGRNIEVILSDSGERYISSVLFEGIG